MEGSTRDSISESIAALEAQLLLLESIKPRQNKEDIALQAVPRDGELLLSFAQQRLWFLDQLQPSSPFYNIHVAIRLIGLLNLAALEWSFNEIVKRHETLRTTFTTKEGQPVQVVEPTALLKPVLINLKNLIQAERKAEILRLATEEAQQPFDLSQGPLIRITLLYLTEEEHILLLTMHHIISDGWSMGIFIQELASLYEAAINGKPSSLTELPIQYADFAAWQRQRLRDEVLERQLTYWQQQLGGDLPILQLPTDQPRPMIQTFKGALHRFRLSDCLAEALKTLSQQEGTTLFISLLTAFKLLLYRYSGQCDILVGSPIANRNLPQIEGLIGFFVNTLVLRTDLSGNPTFRELLRRVHKVALEAYDHQDVPFERLVEKLHPERDMSRNPLFQVSFVLQNTPTREIHFSNLTLDYLETDNSTTKFDLTLELWESQEGFAGVFEYSTDLFEATTIAQLAEHFQVLLKNITTNPDQRLSNLSLLTEAEQERLLVKWNDNKLNYPQGQCIHQLFEAQVKQTPDRLALVFKDQELTYQILNHQANQLAHYLQRLGVKPETLVGICMERTPEMLVAILGVLKAGGAYVPLDPHYPKERLVFMLEDSRSGVLLTQQQLLEQLSPYTGHIVCLDTDWETINQAGEKDFVGEARANNLAYVIYTSGSTGKPKGVAIEHQSAVALLHWAKTIFTPEAVAGVLAATSICFDLSVFELFLPLSCGGAVILAENLLHLPSLAAAEKVTLINTVPSVMAGLLKAGEIPTSVQTVNLAGEPLQNELVRQIYQFETVKQVFDLYGPSEDTTYSTYALRKGMGPATIGRPIANTQVYLLDPDMQPVPVGVSGELYLGGDGLARGYLNHLELTALRFIPNYFSDRPGTRLYKTGDLARYLPDGNIEFLGRVDQQVKIRGFRIELGEIESILAQHPAVQEAVVVVRADNYSDSSQLVAYVIPNLQSHNREEDRAELHNKYVESWQKLYDTIYGQAPLPQTASFNTTGWNSSYTGLPIPTEEMREWIENAIKWILLLQPSRVLEIGCGTGLLLHRVAPYCSQYWGTDFSQVALHFLQQELDKYNLPQVKLFRKMAHDFEAIEADAFDLVIINSVIQYFPSIDYLVQVLEGAVNAVAPGGFVFIGDVRSLPLLETFHTSVELERAPPSLPVSELKERIQRSLLQEKELVIDPSFFTALKERLAKISHVEILPKYGRAQNELTKFRYEVILHVGREVPLVEANEWLDWQECEATLSDVRQLLADGNHERLVIKGIPNGRVLKEVKLVELLATPGPHGKVGELYKKLQGGDKEGIEPGDLWDLGHELGYTVAVKWPQAGDCYEVVFQQGEAISARVFQSEKGSAEEINPSKPWSSYANNPMRGELGQKLTSQLRHYLKEKLPEYMRPSAFVILDAFPLTPSGKINRRMLPAPNQARSEVDNIFVAPRSHLEQTIVRVWQEVLQLEKVGVYDNFFDLGGHSLLLLQVRGKLQDLLKREVSIIKLFQYPNISMLAEHLTQEQDEQPPAQKSQGRAEARRRLINQQKQLRQGYRAR